MRTTAVGDEAYAAKLTKEAKAFRRPRSELERGIDLILRIVTWIIVPAAIGLFLAQYYGEKDELDDALIGTVAGLVALVPQGLVLLLSLAQAVAVIRLGRQKVLVQQLQAVETLARVTLLATDKTGTLTTGAVVLDDVHVLDHDLPVDAALGALAAADPHPDPTIVGDRRGPTRTRPGGRCATGSRSPRRTSTAPSTSTPRGRGTSGAPEVLLGHGTPALEAAQTHADAGDARARRRQGGGRAAAGGDGADGLRGGRPRRVRRRDPPGRRRDDRLLPGRERRDQGDLRRQPAHRVGDRRPLRHPVVEPVDRRPGDGQRRARVRGRGRRHRRVRAGDAGRQAQARARRRRARATSWR